MGFRKEFIWGAASSAYQVEGAWDRDRKGVGVWDLYCREPGRILDGSNGDRACMHYEKYEEDVRHMAQMGLNAYRFSVSWPRIFPEGTGMVNEKGLRFYSDLADCLLEHGIEPWITLFHWNLPYVLYQRGGYLNPDFPDWFAAYAETVVKALSDRVTHFITFNEPQCFVGLGFLTGEHAPGLRMMLSDTFRMAHHVLLAHGKAVQSMRAAAAQPIQIGYAPTCGAAYPASSSPEDVEAAKNRYFACPEDLSNWTWNVSWWSDPVMLGTYPEDGLRLYEPWLPPIGSNDLKQICQPVDFYGQNLYNGMEYRAGNGPEAVRRRDGFPKTAAQWPVTPECLYWGPRFLYERYQTPIYITENGMSCHDTVSMDGKVHDPNRIDFLRRYLRELRRASEDGVDIRGYFQWSLTDNFEWAKGYQERFGLIYVDFQTQERIWKDSAYWYQELIRSSGELL